jgi:hypothetical protein
MLLQNVCMLVSYYVSYQKMELFIINKGRTSNLTKFDQNHVDKSGLNLSVKMKGFFVNSEGFVMAIQDWV